MKSYILANRTLLENSTIVQNKINITVFIKFIEFVNYLTIKFKSIKAMSDTVYIFSDLIELTWGNNRNKIHIYFNKSFVIATKKLQNKEEEMFIFKIDITNMDYTEPVEFLLTEKIIK